MSWISPDISRIKFDGMICKIVKRDCALVFFQIIHPWFPDRSIRSYTVNMLMSWHIVLVWKQRKEHILINISLSREGIVKHMIVRSKVGIRSFARYFIWASMVDSNLFQTVTLRNPNDMSCFAESTLFGIVKLSHSGGKKWFWRLVGRGWISREHWGIAAWTRQWLMLWIAGITAEKSIWKMDTVVSQIISVKIRSAQLW